MRLRCLLARGVVVVVMRLLLLAQEQEVVLVVLLVVVVMRLLFLAQEEEEEEEVVVVVEVEVVVTLPLFLVQEEGVVLGAAMRLLFPGQAQVGHTPPPPPLQGQAAEDTPPLFPAQEELVMLRPRAVQEVEEVDTNLRCLARGEAMGMHSLPPAQARVAAPGVEGTPRLFLVRVRHRGKEEEQGTRTQVSWTSLLACYSSRNTWDFNRKFRKKKRMDRRMISMLVTMNIVIHVLDGDINLDLHQSMAANAVSAPLLQRSQHSKQSLTGTKIQKKYKASATISAPHTNLVI